MTLSIDTGYDPSPNVGVYSLTPRSDGRMLACGNFTSIGGGTQTAIAILNEDGTLYTALNPAISGSYYFGLTSVRGAFEQTDGKWIIYGDFATVNGTARKGIARLNSDLTLDTGFNPDPSSTVSACLRASDGKYYVGGSFTTIGGGSRTCFARLNADGTLDAGFTKNSDSAIDGLVHTPDGKIIVAGSFDGTSFVRLNPDGTTDATFDASWIDDFPSQVVIQPDGKVLLALANGVWIDEFTDTDLLRLEADGTLDTSFLHVVDGARSVALADDGSVIFGGRDSMTIGGDAWGPLARITPDGTLDESFTTTADDDVEAVASIGAYVYCSGGFSTIGGESINGVARALFGDPPLLMCFWTGIVGAVQSGCDEAPPAPGGYTYSASQDNNIMRMTSMPEALLEGDKDSMDHGVIGTVLYANPSYNAESDDAYITVTSADLLRTPRIDTVFDDPEFVTSISTPFNIAQSTPAGWPENGSLRRRFVGPIEGVPAYDPDYVYEFRLEYDVRGGDDEILSSEEETAPVLDLALAPSPSEPLIATSPSFPGVEVAMYLAGVTFVEQYDEATESDTYTPVAQYKGRGFTTCNTIPVVELDDGVVLEDVGAFCF